MTVTTVDLLEFAACIALLCESHGFDVNGEGVVKGSVALQAGGLRYSGFGEDDYVTFRADGSYEICHDDGMTRVVRAYSGPLKYEEFQEELDEFEELIGQLA